MYCGYRELLVKKNGKVVIVQFNRPAKKNSFNSYVYEELTRVLLESSADDLTTIVVITGVGDFFSSGHEITQANDFTDFEDHLKESKQRLLNLILALIYSTKILIAVVNGPCLGIGATMASLCDLIYCSESAYFQTPFSKLGLSPEGCSSYIFPKLLGYSKATEMLAFNEKLSAVDALKYNFVSKIYKKEDLNKEIWPKIIEYSQLPAGSLKSFKILMQKANRANLEEVAVAECDELMKRWQSEDFFNAILAFATRKTSKL